VHERGLVALEVAQQVSHVLAHFVHACHVPVVGQFEFFASEKLRDINAFKCL